MTKVRNFKRRLYFVAGDSGPKHFSSARVDIIAGIFLDFNDVFYSTWLSSLQNRGCCSEDGQSGIAARLTFEGFFVRPQFIEGGSFLRRSACKDRITLRLDLQLAGNTLLWTLGGRGNQIQNTVLIEFILILPQRHFVLFCRWIAW